MLTILLSATVFGQASRPAAVSGAGAARLSPPEGRTRWGRGRPARDDAATASFAALDACNQAAFEQTADVPEAELPSFDALTTDERALVQRVLASALGSDAAGVA